MLLDQIGGKSTHNMRKTRNSGELLFGKRAYRKKSKKNSQANTPEPSLQTGIIGLDEVVSFSLTFDDTGLRRLEM